MLNLKSFKWLFLALFVFSSESLEADAWISRLWYDRTTNPPCKPYFDRLVEAAVNDKTPFLPVLVYMSFTSGVQVHNNDHYPDYNSAEWVGFAQGMAYIIGSKFNTWENVQKYIKDQSRNGYGTADVNGWKDPHINTIKPGGKFWTANYYSKYINALFNKIIPAINAVKAHQNKQPALGSATALNGNVSWKALPMGPLTAQVVSIYDANTIAFCTPMASRGLAAPRGNAGLVDSDVYLYNGALNKVTKNNQSFRYGLMIFTGMLPGPAVENWGNSTVKADFFGGKNALNIPGGPIGEDWTFGFVADEIAAIQKKIHVFKQNGEAKIFVAGPDLQPYLCENNQIKGPGLRPYFDAVVALTARAGVGLFFINNGWTLNNNNAGFDGSKEAETVSAGVLNSFNPNVALWNWANNYQVTQQFNDNANACNDWFAKTMPSVANTNVSSLGDIDQEIFCPGFWPLILTKGTVYIPVENSWEQMPNPGDDSSKIYKLSCGQTKMLALKENGELWISPRISPAAKTPAWANLGIKAHDAWIGDDDTIAVIDSSGKIFTSSANNVMAPTFLATLANGVNKRLKQGSSYVKISNAGTVTLDSGGTNFAVLKHSTNNVVALRTGEQKFIVGSTAAAAAANTLLSLSSTAVNVDAAAAPGQWVLIPTGTGDSFVLQEKLSGLFIGSGAGGALALKSEADKLAFSFADAGAAQVEAPSNTTGATEIITIGSVDNTSNDDAFNVFLGKIDAIDTSSFVYPPEASSSTASRVPKECIKILLWASTVGIIAKDASYAIASVAESAVATALTRVLLKEFTLITSGGAPSALANIPRATALMTKLTAFSALSVVQNIFSENANISLIFTTMLNLLVGRFPTLETQKNAVVKPLPQMQTGLSYDARVTKLQTDFSSIANEASARIWLTELGDLVKNRIDTIDPAKIQALADLIDRAKANNSPSARAIMAAAGEDSNLDEWKTKLTSQAPTLEELFNRLEALLLTSLTASNKTLFNNLVGIFVTVPDAFKRIRLSRDRTEKLKELLQRAKQAYPADAAAGKALSNVYNLLVFLNIFVFDNQTFASGGGFLDTLEELFGCYKNKKASRFDAKNWWKDKPMVAGDARTRKALDPNVFYSLADFWSDLNEYKGWSPNFNDAKNSAWLKRFASQVADSIGGKTVNGVRQTGYFENNQAYTAIKAEAIALRDRL